MSEISNRAIVIAVGLLVTIAITSSVIMVIGYFRDIYSEVKNTDISLRKMFTEFDPYDGTTITGLDVLNGYNKYKDDTTVTFYVRKKNETKDTELKGTNIESVMGENTYYLKFESYCERTDDGAIITCTQK